MYTFTIPNQGRFFLAPLSTEEISEARSLCDECVGENLYGEEEIAATIGASDSFLYFLKKEQDEKVGYIYFYLTDEEYIANYAKLDVELLRAVYAQPNKKVGKIQSVGLKEEYRGMGLATQMILFILNELKKLCIDITFIVCWKPAGTVPLGKTLSECRFSYLTEAKKVWYDDTELICPYCKGRCLCDAEVYYKLL